MMGRAAAIAMVDCSGRRQQQRVMPRARLGRQPAAFELAKMSQAMRCDIISARRGRAAISDALPLMR